MPRPLRIEVPGGVFHVTARGNARRRIFADDIDREFFLALLGKVRRHMAWRCLAYCLMDNHVHLLLRTPRPTLSVGMQRLAGLYAQRYNRRHGRSGHLFQGRFGAVLLERDAHLLELGRYLALNPVRAGLCERPEQWPWSSHAVLVGAAAGDAFDAHELLAAFGASGGDPLQRYVAFVDDLPAVRAA